MEESVTCLVREKIAVHSLNPAADMESKETALKGAPDPGAGPLQAHRLQVPQK